jgi:hypothetical protein
VTPARRVHARALAAFALAAAGLAACDGVLGYGPGHLPDDGGIGAVDATTDASPVDAPGDSTSGSRPDGGLDASLDAATDGWVPTDLGSSLVLWLNADKGVTTLPCDAGGCVKVWLDQSTYHHNDAVPGWPALAPLLVGGSYAGHAAVRFDGNVTSLTVADDPSLQFDDGRYVIATVVAEQMAGSDGLIYSKQDRSTYPYSGASVWANFFNQGHGISPSSGLIATQVDYDQYVTSTQRYLDDGVLRLVYASCDGTTLTLQVGDAGSPPLTVDLGDAGVTGAAGWPAYVGGPPGADPQDPQVFTGDIAELIVVAGTLTAQQQASLTSYLTTKFGLP